MVSSAQRRNSRVAAFEYGLVPFALGVGFGQYLRWSGYHWLTAAGGFWPMFCIAASLVASAYLIFAKADDRTLRVACWLMLTWSWLYVPYWLTAVEVPKSSAVVSPDGRVSMVSEAAPAWLFAGRGSNRIIRNAQGVATIHSIDIKYRYAESFIASRRDGEDLSIPLVETMTAALQAEIAKPKLARIAILDAKGGQARFLAEVCDNVVHGKVPCPLTMTLTPDVAATVPGRLWSKHFTEREAIGERHLPTLISLLTQDNLRVAQKDVVFALFMKLAKSGAEFASVAQKPYLLDDAQFDMLIDRIVGLPGAGNEALGIFASVSRLSGEQRRTLRAKAFQEADIAHIIKHYGAGRVTDAELAELAGRLPAEFDAQPDVALLALEAFGDRLPPDLQLSAVESILKARAPQALSALKYLNYTSPLRAALLRKVITEASRKELEEKLPHQRIEELLTPVEARTLVASVIKNINSKEWLEFATRVVPVRAMSREERKAVVDELMFSSTKAALEFASENRQHLNPADVAEVTRDYTKTVAPDFCLHLTHRNANRQAEYFSDAQIEIFRKCAAAR